MFAGAGEGEPLGETGVGLEDDEDDVDDPVGEDAMEVDAAVDEGDDACVPISFDDIALQAVSMAGVTLPPHQRCAAHVLNLIATADTKPALDINAAFKRVHDSTEKKLHHWWNRQGRSTLVAEILQEGFGVKLEIPGDTRWNGEYDAKKQVRTFCYEKFRRIPSFPWFS